MNKNEAIELMKTAKNVNDWNNKQERVQAQIIDRKERDETIYFIDSSGLIVQTLGEDR